MYAEVRDIAFESIETKSREAMTGMRLRHRQPRGWLGVVNAALALAGGHAELLRHSERPWASATFSGTRHSVLLEFTGDDGAAAAEHFIEALPEHEFVLPGKLVADAAVTSVEQTMAPEARVLVEAELLLLDDL